MVDRPLWFRASVIFLKGQEQDWPREQLTATSSIVDLKQYLCILKQCWVTPFSNSRYIFCGNAGFVDKITITNLLASLLVLVFEVLNFDQELLWVFTSLKIFIYLLHTSKYSVFICLLALCDSYYFRIVLNTWNNHNQLEVPNDRFVYLCINWNIKCDFWCAFVSVSQDSGFTLSYPILFTINIWWPR